MGRSFRVPFPGLEPALLRQGCKAKTLHGKQCTHSKRETADEAVCPY
jgi:hypothetical protein